MIEPAFGGLPNFDKRNNIPISKCEWEFEHKAVPGFAQIIHISFVCSKIPDFALFLKEFFSAGAMHKKGMSLRKSANSIAE